jgi:pyridoxamine 5'-phosphate oxidase
MQEIFLGGNLLAIETACWKLLEEATKSYKAVFHYGAVANIQDGKPAVRTVILRHADPIEKKLFFHTDIRSPKVEALKKDPALSWLFYDEPIKLQLRIRATASLHYNNKVSEDAWQQLKTNSQLTYSISNAPGQYVEETKELSSPENNPDLLHFAKNNFAVVETKVLMIDFLFLHHTGNRRAFFDCVANESYWVQS